MPQGPTTIIEPETPAEARSGRAPAGQDPQKREQILDGAKRCFMEMGFEAASMNAITARAGVSKGTIYVYFENKEQLFSALIEREKTALIGRARHELETGAPLREALQRFAITIVTKLTSDEVIKAQRMVLGVLERLPDAACRFFDTDPFSALGALRGYLDQKVADGELFIEDTELAVRQFMELSMAGIFKRRLFGNLPQPVPAEEVERVVTSGVDMFLSYYGRPRRTGSALPS